MKNLMKNVTLSLLSTAMGIAILAAPLASTVYAAESSSVTMSNSEWDQHHNTDQRHDRDKHDDRDDQDHYKHHFYRMSNSDFARYHMEIYQDWRSRNQIDVSIENPVDVVIAVADVLGFDANNDTFNLVSQNDLQAIVQVIHNGNTYNITVDHPYDSSWIVTAMTPVQ
jgi:Ni/Co efflux regulator RcnB